MRARAVAARLAAILVGIVLALAVCEGALRLVGFEYRLEPIVQFGWPDPQTIAEAYAPDPDLIWVTKDYAQTLAGAKRERPDIVFMGDSCTEFGTYPSRTMAALAAVRPEVKGAKLGVGGWSTEQGRVQMARDVLPLHPKVVTIYFGWNDHWMALGPADRETMMARHLRGVAAHLRIAQVALRAWVAAVERRNRDALRVPIDRYRENLDDMIGAARSAGSRVVVITAPAGHVKGREPVYLAKRHLRNLADLVPLHQAYIRATRDVARRDGVTLCDAEAAFAVDPQRASSFRADGIHLTAAGDQKLAGLLASCIRQALATAP